jgi:hypothetical protein
MGKEKKDLTLRRIIEEDKLDLDTPLHFCSLSYGQKHTDHFSSMVHTQDMSLVDFLGAYMQSFFSQIEDLKDPELKRAFLVAVANKAQDMVLENTSMKEMFERIKKAKMDEADLEMDDDDDDGGFVA